MKHQCVGWPYPRTARRTGFTLVALLGAIATMALLVVKLLPSLIPARPPSITPVGGGWKFNNTLGSDFVMAADRN